ncbi:uncharacterized protein METZ01_LOCUS458687, partial [marine metagenome]
PLPGYTFKWTLPDNAHFSPSYTNTIVSSMAAT